MVLCNKLLRTVLAVCMAVAMICCCGITGTGIQTAQAAETEYIGSLQWSYSIPYENIMESAGAPVCCDQSVFAASGKKLYKFDIQTGRLQGTADLGEGAGRNKLAPAVTGSGQDAKILVPIKGAKLAVVNAGDLKTQIITYADYGEKQGDYQSLTPAAYSESDKSVYIGSFSRSGGGSFAKVSLENYSSQIIATAPAGQGFYWSGACTDGDYVVFGSRSDGGNDAYTPSDGDAVLYAYSKTSDKLGKVTLKDSGSICSTVVKYEDSYYFTGKSGKLYRASVSEAADGTPQIQASVLTALGGASTCTPQIKDGRVYVGYQTKDYKGAVKVIDIADGTLKQTCSAPADVKFVNVINDGNAVKIYATYNSKPGGIYEAVAGADYFLPAGSMQNYCISSIALPQPDSDELMIYTNDSCRIMAVKKQTASAAAAALAAPASPKAVLTKYNSVKFSWNRVSGAYGYRVMYKKASAASYTVLKDTTSLSAVRGSLASGVKYSFRVVPYVKAGKSGQKYLGKAAAVRTIWTLKKMARPVLSKSGTKIKVRWNKINGVSGYQIARSKYYSKGFKTVAARGSSVSYMKIKPLKVKAQYYKVRAYRISDGRKIYAPWSEVRKWR